MLGKHGFRSPLRGCPGGLCELFLFLEEGYMSLDEVILENGERVGGVNNYCFFASQ